MTRVPGDFDEPVRFFGWFTWKDLIRLGIPLGLMWQLSQSVDASGRGTIAFLFAGWLVSSLWFLWRPYNDPVEVQLYHVLRWTLSKVVP